MTKQMLRGIRVASKQELEDRIYLYFDEVNADPIVFHWYYKLNELSSVAGWHQLLAVYFLFVILGTTPGDFFDEKNQEPILIQKALSGMRSLSEKELLSLISLIDLFNENRKNTRLQRVRKPTMFPVHTVSGVIQPLCGIWRMNAIPAPTS